MRSVIQRVSKAQVMVNQKVVGKIEQGFVVLLGIGHDDTMDDIEYLSNKIVNLRVLEDRDGKMNLSLLDIKGSLLIISQFTLHGDVKKGRRPNFMEAAPPDKAKEIYEAFNSKCREYGLKVETGIFGEHMEVELTNDGPVTILIDSKKVF